MALLRDDASKKQAVQDVLKTLFGLLLDMDTKVAASFAEWTLNKAIASNQHRAEMRLRKEQKSLLGKTDPISIKRLGQIKAELKRLQPRNYPHKLFTGDIVHVNFGFGYCGELSSGHYGLLLARRGSAFLIAPLTSTEQKDGINTVRLSGLGLPGSVNDSYVVHNQIRWVHFRRIENIAGLPEGKKNVELRIVDDLLEKHSNIIAVGREIDAPKISLNK